MTSYREVSIWDSLSYADKMDIWLELRPTTKQLSLLSQHCGKPPHVDLRFAKRGAWWNRRLRYMLSVFQPSVEGLRALDAFCESQTHMLTYIEIALDLMVDECDAPFLQGYVNKRLVTKWHGKQKVNIVAGTRYTSRTKWGTQQIVTYADRLSKVSEQPCVHCEWRTSGRQRIERMGITRIGDLIDFDHREFWRTRLCLEELKQRAFGKGMLGRGNAKKPRRIVCSNGWVYSDDYDMRVTYAPLRALQDHTGNTPAQSIRDRYGKRSWFKPNRMMSRIRPDPFLPPRHIDNTNERQSPRPRQPIHKVMVDEGEEWRELELLKMNDRTGELVLERNGKPVKLKKNRHLLSIDPKKVNLKKGELLDGITLELFRPGKTRGEYERTGWCWDPFADYP